MSDDLRAVAPGHAVSALGYDVKLDRDGVTWNDGKHKVSWQAKKQKDGTLQILRKSREVKKHKREAESGAGADLGERELAIIDTTVENALKVLRVKGGFA
jgi:hypothetical protein